MRDVSADLATQVIPLDMIRTYSYPKSEIDKFLYFRHRRLRLEKRGGWGRAPSA